MKEKDLVKEEILKELNGIIAKKDEYQICDIERAEFLKENIDEVVRVRIARNANKEVAQNEEFKLALDRFDIEKAKEIKDTLMQEIYERAGYDEKLPTLKDRTKMLHNHIKWIKILMKKYENKQISEEQLEKFGYYLQRQLDLFHCKIGDLYQHSDDEDILNIKISKDIDAAYYKKLVEPSGKIKSKIRR